MSARAERFDLQRVDESRGLGLQELARLRAQHDAKALKKAIKDFYRLTQPAVAVDELQAAHEIFQGSLEHLTAQLARTKRLRHVTEVEVKGYVEEAAQSDAGSAHATERIALLKAELTSAQRERARRVEYDALARTINSLPSREKGLETRARLEADILALKQEENAYEDTWEQRRQAFDAIVTSLEAMREAIRDEKAEQERRRALDEDDEPQSGLRADAPAFEPSAATTDSAADKRQVNADTMDVDEAEAPDEIEEGEVDADDFKR
ncbi:hypothetical protein OIO90_003413 [Microbotryomycetes sp. JL221]|nr:hypothetical protein OIO90_003413 [Microbotryomycetes sp. JL221]